jgi:hypothetical protein
VNTHTFRLDDETRSIYAALADVLVPTASGMPAASEIDVPGILIEKALTFRPDLVTEFFDALHLAYGMDPELAVERQAPRGIQRTDAPDNWGVFPQR